MANFCLCSSAYLAARSALSTFASAFLSKRISASAAFSIARSRCSSNASGNWLALNSAFRALAAFSESKRRRVSAALWVSISGVRCMLSRTYTSLSPCHAPDSSMWSRNILSASRRLVPLGMGNLTIKVPINLSFCISTFFVSVCFKTRCCQRHVRCPVRWSCQQRRHVVYVVFRAIWCLGDDLVVHRQYD